MERMDVMAQNCCRHLRNLFLARYKTETGEDWKSCPKQGKAFIKEMGKKAYQRASKLQKRMIEKGCVSEWNISTLSMVLNNFGDPKTYEKENEVGTELAGLIDSFHPKQKLDLEEFNEKVVVYRRFLKLLEGAVEGVESKKSSPLPSIDLKKLMTRSELQTGCRNPTEEGFLRERRMLQGMVIEGQELVLRGHQYFMGWDVDRNDKEAVRLYSLAAGMGNAEAIYNLAHCYFNGRGIMQDLGKAYKLYFEAANMPPNSPGKLTPAQKNFGVAHAQHAIGLLYEMGVFVEQNNYQAAIWYKTGADNGSGNAVNNLALLYYKGLGVQRNLRAAEYYWQLGVELENSNAAASLVAHYINHYEADEALSVYNLGKIWGHKGLLEISEEQFVALLDDVKSEREEILIGLLEFENKHNLKLNGLTVVQRLQRQTNSTQVPELEKLFGFFDKYACPVEYKTSREQVDVGNLIMRARDGSRIAIRALDTLATTIHIINCINESGDDELTPAQKVIILESYYKIAVLGPNLFYFPPYVIEKILLTIAQLYEELCKNNKTEASDADMKIRFGYISSLPLNYEDGMDVSEEIAMIKIGIKLYPDNVYYYDLLSYLYRMNNDHVTSLHYVEKGLKKFPTNWSLLYSRAFLLRHAYEYQLDPTGREKRKVVAAYLKFLREAPDVNGCHPKLADAFYALSGLHSTLIEMEYYFDLGMEAETKMLPCYLPINPALKQAALANINMHIFCKEKSTKNLAISERQVKANSVLENKPYLDHPVRREVVMNHRQAICDMREIKQGINWNVELGASPPPKLIQKMGKQGRRPYRNITVAEMNRMAKEDHIFKERVIHLTIIEDPNLSFEAIYVIAEDVNGDVVRLFLYNLEKSEEQIEKLQFGSKIAIANPYLRVCGDGGFSRRLRNDDPKCLAFLGKKYKMCRFCGEENANFTCSKCKRANYCSKECQVLDSKKLKHKLVCFPE